MTFKNDLIKMIEHHGQWEFPKVDLENSIIKLINENVCLSFLQSERVLIESINEAVEFKKGFIGEPKVKKVVTSMYYKGYPIMLDVEETNVIYGMILSHYEFTKKNTFGPQKSIDDVLKKDYIEPTYLYDYISRVLYELLAIDTKKMNIVKMLIENREDATRAIVGALQHLFVMHITKKKNRTKAFKLNYTAMILYVGEFLVEQTLNNHPVIKKFIAFFKLSMKKNNISEAAEIQMASYIKAILDEDYAQQQTFFADSGITIRDVASFSFISGYILNLLLPKYLNNELPFLNIQNYLKTLDQKDILKLAERCEEESKTTIAQIMTLIAQKASESYGSHLPWLFRITNENKKNTSKTKKVVIIQPHALNNLISNNNHNKPFLIPENEFYLSLAVEKNKYFAFMFENISRYIRPNKNCSLVLNDDYFENQKKNLIRCTTDDGLLFLILSSIAKMSSHAEVISTILNEFDSSPEVADQIFAELLKFYLRGIAYLGCFYNYEPLKVTDFSFKSVYDPNFLLVKQIFEYGINFDDNCKVLHIKDFTAQYDKSLLDVYLIKKGHYIIEKISSQKFMVKGLLKDCFLYSKFAFFSEQLYICMRMRGYHNSLAMNVQLFPLARALVHLSNYNPKNISLSNQDFTTYKNSLIKYINDPALKKEILSSSFKEYKEDKENIPINSIKNHLTSTVEEILVLSNQFNSIISPDQIDSEAFLNFVLKISDMAKKRNRTWFVISCFLNKSPRTYPRKALFCIAAEIDCVTNALQCLGIKTRSFVLCKNNNLIGTEKVDFYSLACQEWCKTYYSLKRLYEKCWFNVIPLFENNFVPSNVLKLHLTQITEVFKFPIDPVDSNAVAYNFSRILDMFASLDITNSLETDFVINEMAYTFLPYDNLFDDELLEHVWIIDQKELEVLNSPTIIMNFNLMQKLLVLRQMLKLSNSLNSVGITPNNGRLDEFLNWRDLFKNAVMTFLYNATSYSRKDDFEDKIKEYLDKHSLKSLLDEKDFNKSINFISQILEKFFIHFMKKTIPKSQAIFDIMELLCERGKPVTVTGPFATLTHYPRKMKDFSVVTPTYGKKFEKYQLTLLRPTTEFDPKEFRKKYVANDTHFIDANIMHTFRLKILQINADLRDKGFEHLQINCFIIHDAFYSIESYFLKRLIKDSFYDIINSDPLKWLLDNLEESEKQQIIDFIGERIKIYPINDNFAK